jgi:hypothetical protein
MRSKIIQSSSSIIRNSLMPPRPLDHLLLSSCHTPDLALVFSCPAPENAGEDQEEGRGRWRVNSERLLTKWQKFMEGYYKPPGVAKPWRFHKEYQISWRVGIQFRLK